MKVKRVAVMLAIVVWAAGVAMGQTVWIPDPGNPVVGPGSPGAWDEDGRGPTTVLFDGSAYHMWFHGISSSGYYEIGHATSIDGIGSSWVMDPNNPVLTLGAPGAWDDENLLSAAVIYEAGQFKMWYSGWHNGYERGGYATSPDGTVWTKHPGFVLDVGVPGAWDDRIVRPGTVIHEGGTYKMWYNGYSSAPGNPGRIGYAESPDGISWTKYNDNPVLDIGPPGAWDSLVVGWPSVVDDGTVYYMSHVGAMSTPSGLVAAIGIAFSYDGVHWTKHSRNPVVTSPDEYCVTSALTLEGTVFRMWYSDSDGSIVWIDSTTSTCCPPLFFDSFESNDTLAWSLTVP